MALTEIKTSGIADDAVTTDKLANAINTARDANTAKASITINNNADNRVITGSGTANTLNGEAGLTYDGSHLSIATDASAEGVKLTSTGNTYNEISFDADRTSAGTHLGRIVANWDGTAVSYISMDAGDDTTNKDDGTIRFWTSADGNGNAERMRINSGGQVMINTTNSSSRNLNLKGTFGILSTSQNSVIDMGINDSGQASISPYRASGSTLELKTNASGSGVSTRLKIDSSGDVLIGTDTVPTSYSSGNTLAVIDDGNANVGCIEVGGTNNLNGYNAGSIHFINNANSNSTTPWNANAKIVSIIRTQIVTSDNNAGDDSGADLVFYRKPEGGSGTEGVRFNSNGNVTLADGNLVVANGHGIDFSDTSDASGGTSELLDDYEEGTWTAALSSGETCTSAQATYTRIGRLVTVNCYINGFSDFNGNSNIFKITGLPFPAHNAQGGSYHGGGSITYAESFNYSYPLLPLIGSNDSYIYFHRQDGTTATWKYQDFHNTGVSSGGQLIVQMTYETDY